MMKTFWIRLVPNPMTVVLIREKFGQRDAGRMSFDSGHGDQSQVSRIQGIARSAGSHRKSGRGKKSP